MAMHTDDQTADAVQAAGEGRTATDGPGALDPSSAPVDAVPGAASSHPKPNRIVLDALTDRAVVRIEVDGEIAPDCLPGVSDAVYDDDVVISRLDGRDDRDSFRFSGTMVDLEVAEGDVAVALDLHREDSARWGRPSRLSVHAQGPAVEYEFAVSGAVEPGAGETADGGEAGRDDVVTGSLSGSGVDEYLFTGGITEFETSTDDVLVMVNDQVVDPDDLD